MAPIQLCCMALLLTQVTADMSDFRISRDIVPTHYRLDIQPHFEDDNFTFYGQVWIDVRAHKDAPHISLHSSELAILSATVVPLTDNDTLDQLPPPAEGLHHYGHHGDNTSIVQDPMLGTLTLGSPVRAATSYRLYVRYKGHLSNTLTGFYKESYSDSDNSTRWLASTTFEPNEARRAYPCFDEPGFKARFQVNLASRDHQVALSNMPRRSLHNMTGAPGWVWHRFQETPRVSPYLVAFFVGRLEFRETRTANGTPFRVWARPEVVAQTQYALDIGPRILDLFSSLLGVAEPLPKQDVLALPRFVADALENWGLISFGEKYLLFEDGVSPASRKQRVAHIVAHELAHSWFGNMVSIRWWEDIWLNEGFATYFATVGAHHVDPSWDTFAVTSLNAFLHVFSVDSLQSSHALTFPIGHQSELKQIFDSVTYYKGYYLLRMLNHTLGQSTFLRGCGRYVKEHKFGAVDQTDLWKSLTAQAHEDGALPPDMDLAPMMEGWTSRPGFPVVMVTRNYSTGNVTVSQMRFERAAEDVEARQEHGGLWWIPLTYTSQQEQDFHNTTPRLWLDPDTEETELDAMPRTEDWILFNVQVAGLYRVNYDLTNWELISRFLNSDRYADIAVLNRALLLDDVLDLARVGLLPYHVSLNVSSYLRQEQHYLPWKSALSNLGYIARMLRLTDGLAPYKRFIEHLLGPQFRGLGIETGQDDSYLTGLHRQEVVRWACLVGHHACVHAATALFQSWMDAPQNNPVPAGLRAAVYCTAVARGGPTQWRFLWGRYKNATAVTERNSVLTALGCSEDTDVLKRYLRSSVQAGSGVKPGDSVTVFKAVASTDSGFSIAKEFLLHNVDKIEKAVGPFHLSEILGIVASRMNQPAHLKQLEEFQRKNAQRLQHFTRTVSQVTERVRFNIQWLEHNYDDVYTWLQEREPATPQQT